jgi:hypothetical protein
MYGKPVLLSMVVCAAIATVVHYGVATLFYGVAATPLANPEDTSVSAGIFRSAYFGMTLPLPTGWKLGVEGHPPSQSGEYVLGTLVSEGEHAGTIVMTAQDMFFADVSYRDSAAMIEDFRRSTAEISGMKIDYEPSQEQIGGKAMYRMDFSGVGLFRSMVATEARCHLIRLTLTAPEPEALASVVRNLESLSMYPNSDTVSMAPMCMKGYATDETTLRQIKPVMVGRSYAPIPVRVIISTDGTVKWVHVIYATPDQRRSIEDAVRQWKFRPYVKGGYAREIETGLLFRFTPHGELASEGK